MLLALFIFLLIVIVRGLKEDGYTVQAFEVPKSYSDAGFNGQVVAFEIQQRVEKLKQEANSSRVDSTNLNVNIKQDLNMEVMGVGLSASSMIYHLRELLGKKTLTISGDVTDMDNMIAVNLRMTDYQQIDVQRSYEHGERREVLDKVLDETAEQLLRKTDPYRLAVVYESRGMIDETEQILRNIIVNRPADKKWAYLVWSKVKSDQGDREAFFSYLKKAIDQDENFERAMIALAWAYHRDKDFTEALSWFERCIAIDPNVPTSAYTGAALCHREFGEVDKAEANYKRFIELSPDNLYGYGNYSSFLVQIKGDTVAATNIWKEGAKNIPESGNYHMALGAFYVMNKDTANAYRALFDALELEPENISALSQMGSMLFNVDEDYERAREYLGKALAVAKKGQYDDGFKVQILNSIAMADYKLEDYEVSIKHAKEAISYMDSAPFPWSTLAEAYLLQGNREKFYEAITSAVERGFDVEQYLDEHPYSLIQDRSRILAIVAEHAPEAELKG